MEKAREISENLTINLRESDLDKPLRITLNDKHYVILQAREYRKMQRMIRAGNENLMLKSLEKEILQEMPKDFDDVFIVAKEMLSNVKIKKENLDIYDIRRIVKDIKSNYPNLFINIDEYFKEINGRFE